MVVILDAIVKAWQSIETFDYGKSSRFHPDHWNDEDELTTKLAEILNDGLDNNELGPFCNDRFQTVVRDAKQSTGLLDSIDQMPDLTIRMVAPAPGESRDESALFIEAKLLHPDDGCREYVVNGLHRFVAGKYAPRVTFGLMLGYTIDSYKDIKSNLEAYFQTARSPEARLCKSSVFASGLHTTVQATDHKRNAPCPSDFRSLHLWLVRSI